MASMPCYSLNRQLQLRHEISVHVTACHSVCTWNHAGTAQQCSTNGQHALLLQADTGGARVGKCGPQQIFWQSQQDAAAAAGMLRCVHYDCTGLYHHHTVNRRLLPTHVAKHS